MLRSRLFAMVVVACAHGAAMADLLVTPVDGEARSIHQTILSSQPPGGNSHIDPWIGVGFEGGSGFISFGSVTTNYASGAAGHTVEFFFLGPPNPGNVDYIRFQGHAGARAVLNSGTVTASGTGTSDTRGAFTVTNPVLFSITGFVRIADAAGTGDGAGAASAGVRLTGGSPSVIETLSAFAPGIINLNASGTLQPGTYTLRGFASASASAFAVGGSWVAGAQYDIRMDFQPVPAPGVLCSGVLVGLVIMRRRRV